MRWSARVHSGGADSRGELRKSDHRRHSVLCLQRPRRGDCGTAQAAGQHVTLEQFRIGDVCLWKGRVASGRAAELLRLPRIIESDLLAGRYEGVYLLTSCSNTFRAKCLTLLAAMTSQDDCD